MEISEIDERLSDALMRGDLGVVALKAVRGYIQHSQVRLLTTVERLQKLNMPMETPDGKTTIGSVLLDELGFINTSLTEAFTTIDTTLKEFDALHEMYNFGAGSTDESISNVVAKIKENNPRYATMSDEDIRKELGL